MNEFLSHLLASGSPLLFWALGSLLAYVAATNALWWARHSGLQLTPYESYLAQAARLLYYLGIPYLVLGGWPRRPFQGLLSLEDLGLAGLGGSWTVNRWLQAVGTGFGLGLLAFLLLLLAWTNANRSADRIRLRFSPQPWWGLLVTVLYLEVHWAFYRAVWTVLLNDVYVGVFLGLGLAYLEWGLNPFWRAGWRSESEAAAVWLRAALGLVVALLFLLTRNLWICLVFHGVTELAFWQLGRERTSIAEAGQKL